MVYETLIFPAHEVSPAALLPQLHDKVCGSLIRHCTFILWKGTYSSKARQCAGEAGPRDTREERFLAFARVFSGVIRDGQTVHVLSAAYNPAQPDLERQEVQVR
jgi:hypothetical protein